MTRRLKNLMDRLHSSLRSCPCRVCGRRMHPRFAPQRLDSYDRFMIDPILSIVSRRIPRTYLSGFEIVERQIALDYAIARSARNRSDTAHSRMGDSFSYSNSVDLDSTYFKRLEASCAQSAPLKLINAAVPATARSRKLRLFQKTGLAWNRMLSCSVSMWE